MLALSNSLYWPLLDLLATCTSEDASSQNVSLQARQPRRTPSHYRSRTFLTKRGSELELKESRLSLTEGEAKKIYNSSN